MHPSRSARPASARRVLSALSFLLIHAARPAGADVPIAGVVIDPSNGPVPRAYVRAVTAAGVELAATFADEAGRFRLAVSSTDDCLVVAALTGFEPARTPCAASPQPLRLRLAIAPVHDHVIVSATRTETPAGQTGASATVFTAEDLERRQQPLVADLLRLTPGAMVVRSGARGALTSLFVRGGESNYNKVLLDGVPLNEPGGTFFLNNLTTENLERVEIVRGAYSSLFGSDAMASVVQLFTRRGRAGTPPRISAQLDGGTYGTWHAATNFSGGQGAFDYAVGAAHLASDNRTANSALDSTSVTANVGLSVPRDGTLRVMARGEFERVGTPGQTAFGRPDLDASFDRDDAIMSVSFDQQTTGRLRQRASYGLASSTQASTNLITDPPFTASFEGHTASRTSMDFTYHSATDLRRHHAGYQGDWRIGSDGRGAHILTLLADWNGERATLRDRLAGTAIVASRDNFGVAVQHQMLWPRVFATVGGRLERNETFGTAAVPRGSIVVVAHDGSGLIGETRLRASAGRGIKEPTMLQSFSVSPYYRGNPELEPERARSVEFGIEQRLAGNRTKVEATWFDNRYENIISLRTTNPSTFEAQYFNVGLTRARGLELGVTAAPVPAVRARAGYTLLDSQILASTAPFDVLFREGQWAFRRPRHSGYAGLAVAWHRVTVDVSGAFVGEYVDSDHGLFTPDLFGGRNPGHTVWDARAAYRFTSRLSGILNIDNLTDAAYMEPLGYQPLGRAVRAGVRVGF